MTTEAQRAREREKRILNHMRDCVHFTGISRGPCKAGVDYRTLVGGPDLGWALRIPCVEQRPGEESSAAVVPCVQCQRTSRAEAEAEIAAADAGYERIVTCLTAIKAKHGKARGLADSMPCPTNCGGTLGYTIAGSNGHIWGKCSTKGCASWMQ